MQVAAVLLDRSHQHLEEQWSPKAVLNIPTPVAVPVTPAGLEPEALAWQGYQHQITSAIGQASEESRFRYANVSLQDLDLFAVCTGEDPATSSTASTAPQHSHTSTIAGSDIPFSSGGLDDLATFNKEAHIPLPPLYQPIDEYQQGGAFKADPRDRELVAQNEPAPSNHGQLYVFQQQSPDVTTIDFQNTNVNFYQDLSSVASHAQLVAQDEPAVYSPSNHGQRDDFQQQSLDISARIFEQAVANFERTFFPVPTNDSPQPNQAPSYNSSFKGLPNANPGVSPNEHTGRYRPRHNSLQYAAFEIAGALGGPKAQPLSVQPAHPGQSPIPYQLHRVHPVAASARSFASQHSSPPNVDPKNGFVLPTRETETRQKKVSLSSYQGQEFIRPEGDTLVERPSPHGRKTDGRDVEEQGRPSAVTSQKIHPSAGTPAHASQGLGHSLPALSHKRRRDDEISSPTSPATSVSSSTTQRGQDSPHPFKKIRRDDVSHSVSSSSASSKSKSSEPKKNKNKKREQQTQQDSIGDNFRLMQDLRRLAKPGEIWVNEPGLEGYAPKKKRGSKAGARAAKSRVDKA